MPKGTRPTMNQRTRAAKPIAPATSTRSARRAVGSGTNESASATALATSVAHSSGWPIAAA